jgi:hypothetical protein
MIVAAVTRNALAVCSSDQARDLKLQNRQAFGEWIEWAPMGRKPDHAVCHRVNSQQSRMDGIERERT